MTRPSLGSYDDVAEHRLEPRYSHASPHSVSTRLTDSGSQRTMSKKEGPWVVGVPKGADAPGFRMQKTQNDPQPFQGTGPTSSALPHGSLLSGEHASRFKTSSTRDFSQHGTSNLGPWRMGLGFDTY